MATIDAEGLFVVFGPESHRRQAMDMAKDGAERREIQGETGCTVAVRDATFTVDGPEIFVIMGLSGSGKSTLLRCINRLIEPTAGSVSIDGDDVMAMGKNELLTMRKEKTAMVFQHFGLLDHRTVLENAAFGLELREVPKQEREDKAMESLELVGLENNAHNRVGELSGGMQQRVGLARALTTDAEILLMDEAFSALDPLIRTRMQSEFLDIQRQMEKTILFITHDLGEALALGDRIAIMKDGRVVQIGTPEEIITAPEGDYVASFVENVDRSRVLTAATASDEAARATVSPDDDVDRALEVMDKSGLDFAFVVLDGDVQGAVLRRDAELEKCKESSSLEGIVLETPEGVGPETKLIDILARASHGPAPLPVLDEDGELAGAVTREMLLMAIAGAEEGEPT